MQAQRRTWAIAFLWSVAVHVALLYGLLHHRVAAKPAAKPRTMIVSLIAPDAPVVSATLSGRRVLPKPHPASRQAPPAPVSSTSPSTVPVLAAPQAAPMAAPASQAPAAMTAAPETVALPAPPMEPAGPLRLAGELSVACPERTAPAYPALSRRLGEVGRVLLRVELDEQGRIDAVHVVTGSGYPRLDDAALAAVRNWRCQPAQREGRAVRAVALQPFRFVLGDG